MTPVFPSLQRQEVGSVAQFSITFDGSGDRKGLTQVGNSWSPADLSIRRVLPGSWLSHGLVHTPFPECAQRGANFLCPVWGGVLGIPDTTSPSKAPWLCLCPA